LIVKVSLCEWIKSLLLNFCGKFFSQNSLIPIQTFNGFLIFYNATWVIKLSFREFLSRRVQIRQNKKFRPLLSPVYWTISKTYWKFSQRIRILDYKLHLFSNFKWPSIFASILKNSLLIILVYLPIPELNLSKKKLSRHVQKWLFGGFLASVFETLGVNLGTRLP
jgi:hypothetical protein